VNALTKARLLINILRWRLTWDVRDTDYRPKNLKNPKFVTAHEAVKMIRDGATVLSSGMAGNSRCSIFFWALREVFEQTGRPRDLTWVTVGAQGSRGMVPGTMEELALPGLVTRWIGGHLETVKAFLKLADDGQCELHAMPQGVETFLFEAQANGGDSILTDVGVGTVLDPRVGRGTPIFASGAKTNFVQAEEDQLRYWMPPIDYSLFVAPYADAEGNLYMQHACLETEAWEGSRAARRNGGKALASVSAIIEKDEKNIWMPAEMVDAIVVNPRSEQTGGVPQYRYWPMFTRGAGVEVKEAVEELKFVNRILGITPVRSAADLAVGRLAASLFVRVAHQGALVNIGVGLPEEVCRLVYEGGLSDDITFFTETGVVGGLPTPGIFFGAAINPKKIITSTAVFHRAYEKLDVTVLGFLQVDCEGNVNVAKRGEGAINYVGAGGFPDLTHVAKNIIFVGTWMANAKMTIVNGALKIAAPGKPKFVGRVDEINFNGRKALERGQNVHYVTNVGVFRLTERGMELVQVMPGVDIERDILRGCPMKFVLPPNDRVPLVPNNIVTGRGFRLQWNQ
jgi:propionate CoA-transferase